LITDEMGLPGDFYFFCIEDYGLAGFPAVPPTTSTF